MELRDDEETTPNDFGNDRRSRQSDDSISKILETEGARRLIDLFDRHLSGSARLTRMERVLSFVVLIAVILAACTLSYVGKLSEPLIALLGPLAGYSFGRGTSKE